MSNNKYKILVIEDEENINHIVTALLEANGYKVISAKNGSGGKLMYASHRPDLIILDLGLPDMDGVTFLRELRKESLTPVIVLSARTDEKDKVEALDLGANDYVTKPFSSAEFMARVRSALRSIHHNDERNLLPNGRFEQDGLVIDYGSRQVFMDGEEIKLTQTEYNILVLLAEHQGKVLTYSFIIKAIWGYNDLGSTKKLQVNMANIRKKFGMKPGKQSYIVNELGVGYRMSEKKRT